MFSCSSQVPKTLLTRAVPGHGTGQRAARAVRRTAAVESMRAVRGRVAWRGGTPALRLYSSLSQVIRVWP